MYRKFFSTKTKEFLWYNYDGEFSGWGSYNPSGTLVIFGENGNVDDCTMVSSDIQPRIVVAIDYFDITRKIKEEPAIQFKSNVSKDEKEKMSVFKLTLTLHENLKDLEITKRICLK